MRRSQRVTLPDIRSLYETVHECRELWADPHAWQTHAMKRATAIADCKVGLCYEMADRNGVNADHILSAEDVGWETNSERHTFVTGVAGKALRYSPLYVEFADALPSRLPGASLTLVQGRLIDRQAWRKSDMYDQHVRPTRLGEGIMSGVWMEASQTWSVWCLVNDRRDRDLKLRQQRLTALLHQEMASQIGKTLSTWRDRTVDILAPARRGVLMKLLDGSSEQEIADSIFRSRASVHEHVTAIYRHFGVGSRSQLAAYFLRRQPTRRAASSIGLSNSIDSWLNKQWSPSPS